MKLKQIAVFGCALVAFGCATNVVPFSTGGSRSDGIVELTYGYGMFEKPVVDVAAAQTEALKRCNVWGYPNADPFEGQRSVCDDPGSYGACYHTTVSIKYQCSGTASAPPLQTMPPQAQYAAPPSAATAATPTAPMTSQRQCSQAEEQQKRTAIKNGYTMIPNCQ